MNKKALQIVIVLLVVMNGVSLYFLFRPHPHNFRRPPSIVDVLDIEGESVSKIKAIEAIHFTQKRILMDEIRANKRKVYKLIGTKFKAQTLDSLLSLINSKNYMAEKMTFDYFLNLRTIVPKEKQKELDKFVIDVIANHPGPPKRR
jgi:predicted phosphatase